VSCGQTGPDVVVAVVEHARRTPGRLALVLGEERLTYGELDTWSSAVAADLAAAGARPGDAVAVIGERTPDTVVGQLAALRLGCWYVALDPAERPARRRWIVERCGCAAVLAARSDAGAPGFGPPVIGLDRKSGPSLPVVADPALVAYACFTSGSTGEPKGVLVQRGALGRFVSTAAEAWDLGPGRSLLGSCRLEWDGSVIDLWVPLSAGAVAVGPPPGPGNDAGVLTELALSADVDVVFLPTALAELVLGDPRLAGARRLRVLALGGDRLTVRPPPSASYAVWNLYGPTEITVAATWGVVEPVGDISIGTALPGVTVELLDDALTAVPGSRPGEIVVGGPGVALGYLGDPRRTAAAFVPGPHGRRYRTGDYARRADGRLLFDGRRDRQASVYGRRVELDGVRSALLARPEVRDAAVEVLGSGPAAQLVAFVVGEAVSPAGLRAALGEALPRHQIPDRFVPVDTLPAAADGAVDRDALAGLLSATVTSAGGPSDDRPADDLEEAVVAVWTRLLDRESAAMSDDFFATGGNSLLAAHLVQQVQAAFDIEIRLLDFFNAPTPRTLAQLVRVDMERQLSAMTGTELARLLDEEAP
jgi:amino acid adenylation domain-containing protein